MSPGMPLVIAGVLVALAGARRGGDTALFLGLGNIAAGLGGAIAGAAGGQPWDGAPSLALGALLLWSWWNRRGGRDKARRWLGAKTQALRAALARRMREAAQPA